MINHYNIDYALHFSMGLQHLWVHPKLHNDGWNPVGVSI